jgi:hypothetical protein
MALYGTSGLTGPGMLPASQISASVHSCVSQTAHGRPVRLVDQARYQQRPAIVIILGQPDTVVAVSPSCGPLHSARLTVRG